MYKVVIVDDEYVARKVLKKYFEVYARDFEIAGMFDCGEALIDFLENDDNEVDVIFTDVKMQGITGIDIAKWVCENRPEIKVVIVSGFTEFEWAKEAMRYKVLYYLVKVIDIKEFIELIEHLRIELKDEDDYDENIDLQGFFYSLICGAYKSEEEARDTFYKITKLLPEETRCSVVSVKFYELENAMKHNHYYDDEFEDVIENIIKMLYHKNNMVTICNDNGDYNFIMIASDEDSVNISEKEAEDEIFDILKVRADVRYIDGIWVSELYNNPELTGTMNNNTEKLTNSKRVEKQELKEEFIECVIAHIDSHFTEEISRKSIAEFFEMNVDYIGRQFKEITNKSILEYIQEKRIAKAKDLIAKGFELEEICGMVGYVDFRSFKRLFKKITGQGIKEYKAKIKKEKH